MGNTDSRRTLVGACIPPRPAFLFCMDDRGLIARRGFWPLALLWLPAGAVATAAVRFGAETGRAGETAPWLAMAPTMAGSLVLAAPCGLPLALGCRRVWRLGYRRGAWLAGTGLGAVTVGASLAAGLLGPVEIAIYAAVLSLPVWMAWRWLAYRG